MTVDILNKKSKIYPKVNFIMYKIQNWDFGKLKPLFDKDNALYHMINHIWDTCNIMSRVLLIGNEQIVEESFFDWDKYYKLGYLPEDDYKINI